MRLDGERRRDESVGRLQAVREQGCYVEGSGPVSLVAGAEVVAATSDKREWKTFTFALYVEYDVEALESERMSGVLFSSNLVCPREST